MIRYALWRESTHQSLNVLIEISVVIYERFLVWEEIEGGASVALLTQSEGRQDLRGHIAQDPLRLLPLNTGLRKSPSFVLLIHPDHIPECVRPTLGNVLNVPFLYGEVPYVDLHVSSKYH